MLATKMNLSTISKSRQIWCKFSPLFQCKPALIDHQQIRSITDIEYYKPTDTSHLHLKPAQNSYRKFLIKLKELEKREKLSGSNEQIEDDVSEPGVNPGQYIERGPADILKALASQVGFRPDCAGLSVSR